MKYLADFRQTQHVHALANLIQQAAADLDVHKFMEFCGGHTHAIYRYGLPDLLPANIELVHGPGCPVCVLPKSCIDKAIKLANLPQVILCSYGDLLRVPGTENSTLLQAKAMGADVRIIYSVNDALKISQENPQREVIFLALGFETTTPATAFALQRAKKMQLQNFKVFCNHVLTPAALENLLATPGPSNLHEIRGFIGPAHVSVVIGSQAYQRISQHYQKPIVIAGFEPVDILQALYLLIKQCREQRAEVEVQYTRAVDKMGNLKAQQLMAEVFELRENFEWRGLGLIPHSALQLKPEYAKFDAEKFFELPNIMAKEDPECSCGEVLRGIKKPQECSLFAKVCTPEHPLGSCMVSAEGACAAVYAYRGRAG